MWKGYVIVDKRGRVCKDPYSGLPWLYRTKQDARIDADEFDITDESDAPHQVWRSQLTQL